MKNKQITDTILMIRPANFAYNAITGQTNTFQTRLNDLSEDKIIAQAQSEFDSMVEKLRKLGIQVIVIEDTKIPIKPDAVFPNNWISMHHDGTVITYPMQSENRRIERREDLINKLSEQYQVKRRLSLELFEEKDQYLEGTGSMIFDHEYRIVYACLSPRTDVQLLEHLAHLIQYTPVYFHSYNENRVAVYHTNVMMAIGVDFVVICMDSVPEEERLRLYESFQKSKKEIVEISIGQMNHFAGNMLQIQSVTGKRFLVLSQSAYDSLTNRQIEQLNKFTDLLPVSIPTIETIGGGSVRCMMAEVFLNKLN